MPPEPVLVHRYPPLVTGILLRRYKRFLADVRLPDGRVVTAYTPNSGSMKTCSDPGAEVRLLHDPRPARKTRYTLEMVMSAGTWVGVNTHLANTLAAGMVDRGLLAESGLDGFSVMRREYPWGDSRFDLLLERGDERCLVEVKNVTLRDGDVARFPDAVTSRGLKHLRTLRRAVGEGFAACGLYVVQRSDCSFFGPAREIDPDYGKEMEAAAGAGVILIGCSLKVGPRGIRYLGMLPMEKGKV